MRIHISNGNPDPANGAFESYLEQFQAALVGMGHSVTRFDLRDMDLRGCNGCFNCWVKTPGECVLADDGPRHRQAIIHSDFHLYAAPLRMGYPSALLKTSMDKSIPLIHPYVVADQGEVHHLPRYKRYPRLGLLLQAEADTDPDDLHIVTNLFSRAALNMKNKLEFVELITRPVDELAQIISAPAPKRGLPFDKNLGPTTGQSITPPQRLTFFNGSPRGAKGGTELMASHFIRGFESLPGRTAQVYHLNRIHDREIFQAAYGEAESVLLGFPLYVDAMPGQVKAFIESLEVYRERPNNPPMAFLVQSGFPEALHSRYVERYLEKLAARMGAPYAGTLLRGGVEGILHAPEKVTAPLFETLYQLGRGFAEKGVLDPARLRALVMIEKFPWYAIPVFKVLQWTGLVNSGFDQMLKANGVYEQRYTRPYTQ